MVATPVGALKEPCDLRAPGDLGLFRVLEGDLLEEGRRGGRGVSGVEAK